jgi:hypothetical protein
MLLLKQNVIMIIMIIMIINIKNNIYIKNYIISNKIIIF